MGMIIKPAPTLNIPTVVYCNILETCIFRAAVFCISGGVLVLGKAAEQERS